MIDSTPSGHVGHERAARSPELVVEPDACRQAEEALGDTLAQAGKGTSAVALQREQVLAGEEDRLDALSDRGQVRAAAGLITPGGSHDRGAQGIDRLGEGTPGIPLVAQEDLTAGSLAAAQQLQADLALVTLGAGEPKRPRRAVGGEDGVQAKAPEEAAVRGAVAVVGGIGEGRAADGLAAAGALDWGGVDEQQ